tara:strand:+ start:265 stop:462 length:198 start_codon:yes stop_codon:yes gene_type:complete
MFEAWVLVCITGTMNCFMAQDTLGPYIHIEQCKERTIEMGKDIIENIPFHYPVQGKCVTARGELT